MATQPAEGRTSRLPRETLDPGIAFTWLEGIVDSHTIPGDGGERILVIDTETTGLDPVNDELLQIGAIDGNGSTVIDERFRPEWHASWPRAMEVNRITPESVAGCKHVSERAGRIGRVLRGFDRILGYNVRFDLRFLAAAGIDWNAHVTDVMAEWRLLHPDGPRPHLTDLARELGYDGFDARAHDALEDARATLFVHRRIQASLAGSGPGGATPGAALLPRPAEPDAPAPGIGI